MAKYYVQLQAMLALRFLATGTFLLKCVKLPNQQEADLAKAKFYEKAGFQNAIGRINAMHVCILAPLENQHEYINKKNFHSINVQATITLHLYQTLPACHVLNFQLSND